MSAAWLTQLAPAHAPAPPSWWPPAPGWWALALLAAALAALAVMRWRDPHRAARRAALRELKRIRADDLDLPATARAIESLLRRYAIAVFGRARVARLTGSAWLEFVNREGGAPLAGEAGASLLAAAFGGTVRDDRDRWLQGADAFVRQTRRAPRERR